AFAQVAGVLKPEDVRAQPAGAADEIADTDHVVLADVARVFLGEGRVLARMAVAAVRAGDHPRLAHEQVDVFLFHVERGDLVGRARRATFAGAVAALGDDAQCGVDRIDVPFACHVGQGPAGPRPAGTGQQQRVRAAAATQVVDHLRADARARVVVFQPLQQRL